MAPQRPGKTSQAPNTATLVRYWGFTSDDRLLHALPIFHSHGLFVATNTVLLTGASILFLPRFDAEEALRLIPQATVMMGVPTFYSRLLGLSGLDRSRVAGMRLFVSGSAPLLEETFREFEQRTGHRILERYGMTEIGMALSNPLDGERRPGAVGRPLPGVGVRLVDDAGEAGGYGSQAPFVIAGDLNARPGDEAVVYDGVSAIDQLLEHPGIQDPDSTSRATASRTWRSSSSAPRRLLMSRTWTRTAGRPE